MPFVSTGEIADLVGEEGRVGLDRLRAVVRGLVDHDGITYTKSIAPMTMPATRRVSSCPGSGTSTACRWSWMPMTGTSWRPESSVRGCWTWCSGICTGRAAR